MRAEPNDPQNPKGSKPLVIILQPGQEVIIRAADSETGSRAETGGAVRAIRRLDSQASPSRRPDTSASPSRRGDTR